MTHRFPIGNVRHIGHIEVGTRAMDESPAFLEIYTGWIDVGLGPVPGTLVHEELVSFVPIESTVVKQYPEKLTPTTAVVAGLETIGVRHENATHGVDFATVALERQQFATEPLCLVLRAHIGFQDVWVYNMTYHVTLLWSLHQNLPLIDLPPSAKPN
ncbi:hypothetical protein ACGFYU_33305 [Streptomyces sp. NPDC048337]|uniref:hypothetical protein n=1 Tax=Streptomyces sp. NPDC048337 TaxID=3365535 RepID=UPI0037176E0A